ncbi:MAG: ROK family protein [Fusobacteriaceae bacterium]
MKYYVGTDIGGTKIATIISDENFNILSREFFSTTSIPSPSDTLNRIIENIHMQLKELSIEKNSIKSIGISCGGPLNSKKGVILSPPNLPGWDNIEIVNFFKKSFNVPVYLQNDANACALAEWKLGAGKGYENLIFLTFGTGMGAGLILNSRLYLGKNDCAGEVGHIRLTPDGPLGFGKQGSFEGYCSGGGLVNLGRIFLEKAEKKGYNGILSNLYKDEISAKDIIFLARDHEPLAVKIIEESAKKLGEGLAILVDILNPEAIIIGSIYERAYDLYEKNMMSILKNEAISDSLDSCDILPAKLGDKIGDFASIIVATGEY